MNPTKVALGIAGAVVIAAVGFFAGSAVGGRAPESVAAEAAVKPAPSATPEAAKLADASTPAATLVAQLSDDQITEVEGIIKNYLMAHPEVIRDAINELQRRQDAAEKEEQVKAIADNSSALFTSPRHVVIGNPDGDVTLIEFFDYNCGYCKRAHADMNKLLEEDKKLRIVLKEFPVLGPGSVEAAQVSVAVKMIAPDKAAAFFHEMMEVQGQVNGDKAIAVAEDLGIDAGRLRAAMASDEVKETISESYDLASKLSLTGTPSYVTTQEVVIGAVGYDSLKAKVAEARAACAQPSC